MVVEVLAAPQDHAGGRAHVGPLAGQDKLVVGFVPELIQQPVEILHLSAPALRVKKVREHSVQWCEETVRSQLGRL